MSEVGYWRGSCMFGGAVFGKVGPFQTGLYFVIQSMVSYCYERRLKKHINKHNNGDNNKGITAVVAFLRVVFIA